MDNSTDPEFTVCGGAGYRGSDPARLCCALTRLSRALAPCVPRTEMRVALTHAFCDCRGRNGLLRTRRCLYAGASANHHAIADSSRNAFGISNRAPNETRL